MFGVASAQVRRMTILNSTYSKIVERTVPFETISHPDTGPGETAEFRGQLQLGGFRPTRLAISTSRTARVSCTLIIIRWAG